VRVQRLKELQAGRRTRMASDALELARGPGIPLRAFARVRATRRRGDIALGV
jgi:hypothetical protein